MMSKEEFIVKARQIHKDEYDYSKVIDTYNRNDYVIIICKIHGEFRQQRYRHLNGGHKCKKCQCKKNGINQARTTESFIEECYKKLKSFELFDYSKVNYINAYTGISLKCNKCNEWFVTKPFVHLNYGCGCPLCKNKSKGEFKIKKFLEENHFSYIPQKRFKECKGKRNTLPFDFYLTDLNILIEYDGIQHFKSYKSQKWKTPDKHKIYDNIKSEFCLKNNIKLLRISYLEFNNIEEILKKELLTTKETLI